MPIYLHQILKLIAPCLHCGSLVTTGTRLCSPCLATMSRFEVKEFEPVNQGVFSVYPYFHWHPGESDILSTFFLSLKGSNSRSQWREMALHFVQKRCSFPLLQGDLFIIPAPSTSGSIDHAYIWAQEIAEILNANFLPCLKKVGGKRQRGASRYKRSLIRMDIDENYSEAIKSSTGGNFVFIDDIITTGATAHAAYEALGCPVNFECWVLGYRRLSCGDSGSLI